jgi:hypothetical protein
MALTVDLATAGTECPWIEFTLNDTVIPPTTPGGLVATPDREEIELDWTASGNVPDGYEVRIDGGTITDVGNVLTHTFTGLTPGTEYTLEVRAYNAAGDSSWASIDSTTLLIPPGTPTGLTATPAATAVLLEWNASTNSPDGYRVRVDGGPATDVGLVLSELVDGLYPATTYELEVQAYNEDGDSAWASIESTTLTSDEIADYTATITIGDLSFTIERGVCDLEDSVIVLDGLRIGWDIDESAPWPAQPNPVSCQLGLWTSDVAELDAVVISTPVSVELTDVAEQTVATFHGRIVRQAARPRRGAGTSLSMLYSFSALDYTVDLAETPVTITDEWPAESGTDRLARIYAACSSAGLPFGAPPDGGDSAFAALSAGTTTAAALLEDHLRQIAIDVGDGLQRYIVVPVVTGGVLEEFGVTLLERTVDASLLPGVIEEVGGLLTLTFPDEDAQGLVDACVVDLDVQWNRLKYRAVNVVTVAADEGLTATAAQGTGPPVRLTLESTLTNRDALEAMAELYLPDVAETNGWVADAFRLHAWREPASITPSWFPDHSDPAAPTTVYVMPIAIVNVPANVNLAGPGDVYAGQLVKVELTVEGGRIMVDFALRRQLPAPVGADAVTWDWISANHPTITWDDIDPGLTWYDLRLGRTP